MMNYIKKHGWDWDTNRGYGEPLMGFWPYLRQAHMSEERPSAGTWQTFLRRFFLKWKNQEIINQRSYFTKWVFFKSLLFCLLRSKVRLIYLLLDLGLVTEPAWDCLGCCCWCCCCLCVWALDAAREEREEKGEMGEMGEACGERGSDLGKKGL